MTNYDEMLQQIYLKKSLDFFRAYLEMATKSELAVPGTADTTYLRMGNVYIDHYGEPYDSSRQKEIGEE
jgi:hypothetical protein